MVAVSGRPLRTRHDEGPAQGPATDSGLGRLPPGWVILPGTMLAAACPAERPQERRFALLHSAFGVAILDVLPSRAAPVTTAEAAATTARLLARLEAAGFANIFPGYLPVLHLGLPETELPRLPQLLEPAFAALPALRLPPGEAWTGAVQRALTTPLPVVVSQRQFYVADRRRLRRAPMRRLWLVAGATAAVVTLVLGAALLGTAPGLRAGGDETGEEVPSAMAESRRAMTQLAALDSPALGATSTLSGMAMPWQKPAPLVTAKSPVATEDPVAGEDGLSGATEPSGIAPMAEAPAMLDPSANDNKPGNTATRETALPAPDQVHLSMPADEVLPAEQAMAAIRPLPASAEPELGDLESEAPPADAARSPRARPLEPAALHPGDIATEQPPVDPVTVQAEPLPQLEEAQLGELALDHSPSRPDIAGIEPSSEANEPRPGNPAAEAPLAETGPARLEPPSGPVEAQPGHVAAPLPFHPGMLRVEQALEHEAPRPDESAAELPPVGASLARQEPLPEPEAPPLNDRAAEQVPSGASAAQIAPPPEPEELLTNEQMPPGAEAPRARVGTAPLKALDPKLVDRLLARGEEMLARGDVSAARLLYARAAEAGSAAAATAMGRSFDPEVLARLGVRGIRPDPAQAAQWYRRATELGATR